MKTFFGLEIDKKSVILFVFFVALAFVINLSTTTVYAYEPITTCVNNEPSNGAPKVHPLATINVNVIAASGRSDQLGVILKNSNGEKIREVKTCGELGSPGTSVTLKTAFYDVDAGSYSVCADNKCSDIEVSDGALGGGTVDIGLVASQDIQVLVKLHIPTLTEETKYGPIEVSIVDHDGKFLSSATTNSKVMDAGLPAQALALETKFTGASPGNLYQACIDLGTSSPKCSAPVVYVLDSSPTLTIEFDETESAKFVYTPNPSADTPTCGSVITTGIGWIVCPVISTLTALNDSMWSFVENLLFVNPISKSNDGVYKGWVTIRNISNVFFVIAFLVIIFSQLSGFGISNYGVKKLLPRIIVVAIAINLSFIVMQAAIDATNIIGKGLYDVIYASSSTPTIGWADALKLVLGGSGIALGAGAAALVILGPEAALLALLPILLSALVSFLAAALTLIFRQAIIPILAMIAPLAFIANLLPNTEQWFKKWSKLLLNMLMLYPMAALVFAGARFASSAIIGEAVKQGDTFNMIIGLIVLSLPLFSLPFLSRQGAPMLAKVSGALNNFGKKVTSPVSEFSKELSKDARVRGDNAAMNAQNPKRLTRLRQRYLRSSADRKAILGAQKSELDRGTADYISEKAINDADFRNKMAAGGAAGADRRALASAINVSSEINAKEVKAADAVINRLDLSAKEIQDAASGVSSSVKGVAVDSAMREAAIARSGLVSTVDDMEAIVASSGSMNSDQRRALVGTLGSNGFKAKAAWYNGATMGKIQSGAITSAADLDSVVAETIKKSDISAEELMAMDADALAKMHTVMGTMAASDVAKLKRVALEAVTNPLLSSKLKENRVKVLTDLAT